MAEIAPCEVCGFPTFLTAKAVKDAAPLICSTCEMVALDLTYQNGSSPSDRLPDAKVEQIKASYFELQHALL